MRPCLGRHTDGQHGLTQFCFPNRSWAFPFQDIDGGLDPNDGLQLVDEGRLNGQRLGQKLAQQTPWDSWSENGGVLFDDLIAGEEMVLRAAAPGYTPQDMRAGSFQREVRRRRSSSRHLEPAEGRSPPDSSGTKCVSLGPLSLFQLL